MITNALLDMSRDTCSSSFIALKNEQGKQQSKPVSISFSFKSQKEEINESDKEKFVLFINKLNSNKVLFQKMNRHLKNVNINSSNNYNFNFYLESP